MRGLRCPRLFLFAESWPILTYPVTRDFIPIVLGLGLESLRRLIVIVFLTVTWPRRFIEGVIRVYAASRAVVRKYLVRLFKRQLKM